MFRFDPSDRRARFALFAAAALLAACGEGDEASPTTPAAPSAVGETPAAAAVDAPAFAERLDHQTLVADARALSADAMDGRAAGTEGGAKARAYILERFSQIGLRPIGDGQGEGRFEHPFIAPAKGTPRGFAEAVNLIGFVPGSAPGVMVLTAHYDHLGAKDGEIFNGADDNASGVATLLAIAADLVANPPRHPVIIAALDAEELGKRGAEAFVQRPPTPLSGVALNVNLDMVARADKGEIYAAGTYHYPFLTPYVAAIDKAAPLDVRTGHDRPEDGVLDWTDQSDHAAFHLRGVPFVYFGVEDHADYHKPSDTFDKIDRKTFIESAETIAYAVRLLDENLADIMDASGR